MWKQKYVYDIILHEKSNMIIYVDHEWKEGTLISKRVVYFKVEGLNMVFSFKNYLYYYYFRFYSKNVI